MTDAPPRHNSLSHDPAEDLPADLSKLYEQYGIAAETAQVLEVEAGNFALAYLAMFVNTDDITDEQTEIFRAIIDDLNRKTLGAMFREIRKIAKVDQELLTIMDKALERRNYLTHNFFRSHNFAIQTKAGRADMISELKDIAGDIRYGLAVISTMTNALNELGGHTAKLERLNKKYIRHGKRIDI